MVDPQLAGNVYIVVRWKIACQLMSYKVAIPLGLTVVLWWDLWLVRCLYVVVPSLLLGLKGSQLVHVEVLSNSIVLLPVSPSDYEHLPLRRL